ncbi:MAG: metallophosphoesterase [Bacteroidota bacterium]|nr:metallophosphoesterase [Bacteroidota bacterium]MDP4217318.1 metallophosphoesterase [Bacteroidota bacterium]MDP4247346.1 metallophosphoesterase [Bacteroidota bacterium]MDP4253916.1 metallophosphoesterase [Bacteroidota bacterium]MDP4257279.1 metallophosphoesterase [Bacteroidota bacterium]
MKTFVMGDIHGAYAKLLQCLQRSGFDHSTDRLIQLGDVADRGDRVAECVDELLGIKNLIAIRGNHDDWFNHFLLTGVHPVRWEQGGDATARSYLRRIGKGKRAALRPADVPESHRRFFAGQRLYFIDESNNCFVHAGFDRHRPFGGQPPEIYFWDRELWTDALGHQFEKVAAFRQIFIGHTPTANWGVYKPMHAANIYNLDTGAGREGYLSIMDVATKKFWQSDATLLFPGELV